MSDNNGKHHDIKIMQSDDVDAIIEKMELTPESVLIVTIPNNLSKAIMQSIYEQFMIVAKQWGTKLGFDGPISFVICTMSGIVLTLNEKNPYVTIKELKDSYLKLMEICISEGSDWSDKFIEEFRQEKMQELQSIISFTMLDDISEDTLALREATRGIKRPTWNEEKNQYEFWTGIVAMAHSGVIGLAPDTVEVKALGYNLETVPFYPDEVTTQRTSDFTNAEKIAVADMMIDRWKVYRNTHMKLHADWLANQRKNEEGELDE